LCFTPPENEFGNRLFLNSRFLVDLFDFLARTGSYESKKVSGGVPDVTLRSLIRNAPMDPVMVRTVQYSLHLNSCSTRTKRKSSSTRRRLVALPPHRCGPVQIRKVPMWTQGQGCDALDKSQNLSHKTRSAFVPISSFPDVPPHPPIPMPIIDADHDCHGKA